MQEWSLRQLREGDADVARSLLTVYGACPPVQSHVYVSQPRSGVSGRVVNCICATRADASESAMTVKWLFREAEGTHRTVT